MNKLLKEYKRDYTLLSIGYIALGALLLFMPETSGKIMCYIIAAISTFFGVMHIIAYLNQKYPYETYRFDLVYGIVGLSIGLIVFMKPELLISFLPTVLGIVVFIDSIVKIQHAVDLKRMNFDMWWVILLLALGMSGIGLLMMMYPFSTFMTVVMFAGIGLIVNAVVNLYAIHVFMDTIKNITRRMERKEEKVVETEVKETELSEEMNPIEKV